MVFVFYWCWFPWMTYFINRHHKGNCPKTKNTGHCCVSMLFASLLVLSTNSHTVWLQSIIFGVPYRKRFQRKHYYDHSGVAVRPSVYLLQPIFSKTTKGEKVKIRQMFCVIRSHSKWPSRMCSVSKRILVKINKKLHGTYTYKQKGSLCFLFIILIGFVQKILKKILLCENLPSSPKLLSQFFLEKVEYIGLFHCFQGNLNKNTIFKFPWKPDIICKEKIFFSFFLSFLNIQGNPLHASPRFAFDQFYFTFSSKDWYRREFFTEGALMSKSWPCGRKPPRAVSVQKNAPNFSASKKLIYLIHPARGPSK